jgi:hypothetical protein
MRTAERTLRAVGLQEYWFEPARVRAISVVTWRKLNYDAVNAKSNTDREARMQALSSTATYMEIKEWGANPPEYSFSSGEENRIGQHVPERCLDDRDDLKGTRLKCLSRLGVLPVMRRIGREQEPPWPRAIRTCLTCNNGEVEDVEHFIMRCSNYEGPRRSMMADVRTVIDRSSIALTPAIFDAMSHKEQCNILLGQRIGDPVAGNRIDRNIKRYLKKAWNRRAPVTASVNAVLGKEYEVVVWRR